MPSKSKAQARLFAAAAHNPEIAKKVGISQKAAKEWNHADKEAGTLKKNSDKPEHVKEEVLDEASGVGILKVPPSLLNQVQRYISSILLTMGLMKQKELELSGSIEQATALNTYLKRFQTKFNASVLSDANLKKYVNSINTIKIDSDEVFSQLPETIKKRPGVKELLDNLTMKVLITDQLQDEGRGGSNSTQLQGKLNIQEIGIPSYENIKNGSLENLVHKFNYSMGTVAHELQHAMQTVILKQLNSNDMQAERKPDYDNMDDAYYASGIEYGPQVQDLATKAKEWLDNNPDDITGNKNTDISNAIKFAMSSYHQGKIIKALRNFKHDDRANKALKLIYRDVNDYYVNEYADQSDSGNINSSEQDVFHDTDENYRMLTRPKAGDSLLGDLWLSINKYYGEKPTVYGNYDDIRSMKFNRPYGEIEFEPGQNGAIHMYVKAESRDDSYHLELSNNEAKTLLKDISLLNNLGSVHFLKDKIEQDRMPNVNLENSYHELEEIKETESMFSTNPNKKISIEYDPVDMNIWVSFKGARELMYIQESGKNYNIGYDETDTGCTSKDFKAVFEELFQFYYNSSTTDRMINKMLRHIVSQSITPDEIKTYAEYLLEQSKSKEESMTESSMRSLADIVQNAELVHDMDDADKQELINKGMLDEDDESDDPEDQEYDLQGKPVQPGQRSAPVNAGTSTERLEEMPQAFDAFQGQNPDDFVDRTAKMNNKNNMILVSEHDGFDIMKSKNGTGYIAYDKQGHEIAIVSGYSSGKIFHEEAIASKSTYHGVVYQIYMDILKEGFRILSDTLHSNDAINFWKKLITKHEVYVVGDGKILAKATPEKFQKYWGDENSPSAELQLLLVK